MKTVTSISGGQSSAYVAANYPSDFLVFALVTVKDRQLLYPDAAVRKQVSDRIGREFVGTVEDDTIICTVLDLEQHLGQPINWVAGKPFEDLRKNSLPNITWRHCTELMKIKPMFEWWRKVIGKPVEMRIGFRAGEEQRAHRMLAACDQNGLRAYRNTPWQKPVFPMIDGGVKRDKVVLYWREHAVRFAPQNNCVGCFHRNPLVLRKMYDLHPKKMQWFANMEKVKGARWKSEVSYEQIKRHRLQAEINFEDWGCDSGHCGL